MAAKGGVLEESRDELVVFHLQIIVYLAARTMSSGHICQKKHAKSVCISTNVQCKNSIHQLLEKSILKNIRINILYQLTRKVKEESTNRTSLMFFFLSAPFLALSLEMSTTPSPSPSTSAVWVILPSYSLALSSTQPSWKGER